MGIFSSIVNDAKNQFRYGNMINQIIVVNVMVFLVIVLSQFITALSLGQADHKALWSGILSWIAMPYDPVKLLTRPWTIITYNFLHQDPWHILWNMLFLYWFGRIFQDLIGTRRVLPVYIYGGIAGGLLSLLLLNAAPGLVPEADGIPRYLLGASAGVTAVMIASATLAPEHIVRLIFFDVRLKYLALALLILDFFVVGSFSGNEGGHLAHIGGAVVGYFYIIQLQNGKDWASGFNKVWDAIVLFVNGVGEKRSPLKAQRGGKDRPRPKQRKSRMRAETKRPRYEDNNPRDKQDKVDEILDKIARSGYDSLSKEEKEFLFKVSKED